MDSRAYMIRQTEVGEIIHQGRTFAACGSSVNGGNVTGYHGKADQLNRWDGSQLLGGARYQEFSRQHLYGEGCFDEAFTVGWRLTGGRWLVGLSYGTGMIVRLKLITAERDDDDADAIHQAREVAALWLQTDIEDEAQHRYELEEAERWDGMD